MCGIHYVKFRPLMQFNMVSKIEWLESLDIVSTLAVLLIIASCFPFWQNFDVVGIFLDGVDTCCDSVYVCFPVLSPCSLLLL